MNLDDFNKIASIISSLFPLFALVIGGAWAYYLYFIKREAEWNLAIDGSPRFLAYGDNLLLTVTISLKNIGRVKISPTKKGCWLSLRRFPIDRPLGEQPHWNQCTPILENYDVIRSANPNHDQEPIEANYWLAPGAEYLETVNVVIPRVSLVMAEIGFSGGRGEEIWVYKLWEVPHQLTKALQPMADSHG